MSIRRSIYLQINVSSIKHLFFSEQNIEGLYLSPTTLAGQRLKPGNQVTLLTKAISQMD